MNNPKQQSGQADSQRGTKDRREQQQRGAKSEPDQKGDAPEPGQSDQMGQTTK